MSDDRVRLFVALALPDPVRDALVRWRERVAASADPWLRPVAREALHVTLCFLGWRAQAEVDGIAAACGVVGAEPPAHLALGDAVWLPPRRPRVLAVELDDLDGTLATIQAALSAALAAGGWYAPEKRPYLAHVTVGRSGGARRANLTSPSRVDFHGSDVVLYRSRLLRSGARYEPLARIGLSG